MTPGVPETVSRPPTTLCFSAISGSLPQGTKPIKLLNKNAMGPVRFLDKIGARRHSICHKRLFVGIVLRLLANQDSVLGRSRIYVIQFSLVSNGGNLAGRQCANSLLLFGRGHGLCPESGAQQQIFLLGCRTGTDGSALAAGHRPSDKITTNTSENRNVFSIFLIPLFGCAFAVLFVGRQRNL
jgi:hypothetical protein